MTRPTSTVSTLSRTMTPTPPSSTTSTTRQLWSTFARWHPSCKLKHNGRNSHGCSSLADFQMGKKVGRKHPWHRLSYFALKKSRKTLAQSPSEFGFKWQTLDCIFAPEKSRHWQTLSDLFFKVRQSCGRFLHSRNVVCGLFLACRKSPNLSEAFRFGLQQHWKLAFRFKIITFSYDGDLMDDEKILEWLTSQDVFEIKDEIEEVNRKMLEKLLDENDFVAVYFCKQSQSAYCTIYGPCWTFRWVNPIVLCQWICLECQLQF